MMNQDYKKGKFAFLSEEKENSGIIEDDGNTKPDPKKKPSSEPSEEPDVK